MTRPVVEHLASHLLGQHTRQRPYVIGVTGQDAGGKTRLSDELETHLTQLGNDVVTVHVDDFHRPRSERYARDLSEVDAYLKRSFDFDSLESQILAPLKRDGHLNASLYHLDVATDARTVQREYRVSAASIVIVEGVLLLQEQTRRYFDMVVFVHADRDTLLDRAFVRNVPSEGIDVMRKYNEKYLPAQQAHLHAYPPRDFADLIVDNSVWCSARPLPFSRHLAQLFTEQRTQAFIFDLWETLVPFPATAKRRAFFATAEALGEDPRLLRPIWASTRRARETMPLDAYLGLLSEELDRGWNDKVIKAAMRARQEIHGPLVAEAAQTIIPLLRRLRKAGAKTGLVSNCTSDVRRILDHSCVSGQFDSVILSAEEGHMKPEPHVFAAAITELNVPPDSTCYVGDGADSELVGAGHAGLHPIQLNRQDSTIWPGTTSENLEMIVTAYENRTVRQSNL